MIAADDVSDLSAFAAASACGSEDLARSVTGATGQCSPSGVCLFIRSCQVLLLRTLAGRSATMSEPARACSSRTLTRIQRCSPVRVRPNRPESLWPYSEGQMTGLIAHNLGGALIPYDDG